MNDPILLGFGDVFCVGDQDYVYLGATLDTVYAAKILTKSQTDQLSRLATQHAAKGHKVGCQGIIT